MKSFFFRCYDEKKTFANPKKSKIMGVNGFRRYKNYYTSEKMAKKYLNIILNKQVNGYKKF